MLANNLTMDEEDAVQAELRELQAAQEPDKPALILPQPPTTAPTVPVPIGNS